MSEFLKECIEGCVQQTLKSLEILIGDDSPGEDTVAAVHSFDVDSLIQLACGDLCCLIHEDDLLEPDALENLSRVFTEDNNVIFSYGK